ncbi:MAG TPA: hypothetical protein VHE30_22100 [Polyangiaceae bacterium]|nr:hypothetical protein [Polyangiaceae bacterium]
MTEPENARSAAAAAEPPPAGKPEPRTLTKDGMDRPRFVLDFPADPALDRLVAAFEVGNYALVRADAPKLARETDRAEVRAAAEELLRRIEPDPLAKYLLVVSAVLLAILAAWAYHVHP